MTFQTEVSVPEGPNSGAILDPDDLLIDYDAMKLNHNCLVITVTGELVAANAQQLDQALDLPSAAYARIALDLRGVPLCDADGIITLLKIKSRARQSGQEVRLVNLSSPVQRFIEVSGITELLLGQPVEFETPASF